VLWDTSPLSWIDGFDFENMNVLDMAARAGNMSNVTYANEMLGLVPNEQTMRIAVLSGGDAILMKPYLLSSKMPPARQGRRP
jgi:hypothetical protein